LKGIDAMLRSYRIRFASVLLSTLALMPTPAAAVPPCEKRPCPSNWLSLSPKDHETVFAFAEDYKDFMGAARTELTTVRASLDRARKAGFREWSPDAKLIPGSRWYRNNRDRSLVLFVIGTQPMAQGFRIAASHIDSPRLDLKARPLYEKQGFALFQTNTHGNLLNYQWGNIPLALVGRISRKDGTSIDLSIGLKPDEPVFMIAGLSPHVDADLRDRTNRDVLAAEELDPIVGSMPKDADDGPFAKVAEYLRETYAVSIDDLVSAELALVPASAPRDVGFDRAMMTMYGQDDRLGAYASLRALADIERPKITSVLLLADNEETGNNNNTGAASDNLVNLLGELLYAELGDRYRPPHLSRALERTKVLSTDVNDAVNPTWPGAWEEGNAPHVGEGVNIKVYGQGNNATSEYAAWVRRILDDAGIHWQTATYKVGRASGGTLGGALSRRDMDVIDIGAPVLSIHNSQDLSSKIDLWSLYNANRAFFTAP
jgi:aspartyl aminopeptidase